MSLIKHSRRPVSEKRMTALLRSLFAASTLCAIATVTRRGSAYVNTAYFAWTPRFDLVWLSAPAATHSRNLQSNMSAAVAVFDSNQVWGNADRGLQVFGTAAEPKGADLEEAEQSYRGRFPDAWASNGLPYRFYLLRPRTVKLFDERELGPGLFVTASVRNGGRLVWRRTEIYEPGESRPHV
jgi:hypothetical protein